MEKVFVGVSCEHLPCGTCVPKRIVWRDGRSWEISRVIHSCSSNDGEFEGIRYTILIGSAEKYLYQAGNRFYVEPAG